MTGKDVVPEKDLLGLTFVQTNIAKKQYQKLDDTYVFDKTIKNKKQDLQNITDHI